jgi:hypothetical protein
MSGTPTKQNTDATEAPAGAPQHLRLIYDKEKQINSGNAELIENSITSVPPFPLLPNGVRKDVTEKSTEQGRRYIEEHQQGSINLRALYGTLRKLWSAEVFEGSRHCFENMKQRTKNNYADLDPRFVDFPSFLHYMGPRPFKSASIHRKDNNEGYSPENCEWADKTTQSRERTNTVYLTCDGEKLPLTEWAERLNIPARILRGQKERGWSDRDVIHGNAEGRSYPAPPDAPWPSCATNSWESAFRKVGGKTPEERLMFVLKRSINMLRSLHSSFKEDWSYPDTLSTEELAEYHAWDKLYTCVFFYFTEMRKELQRRARGDLIHRCEKKSIEELFAKEKYRRSKDHYAYAD